MKNQGSNNKKTLKLGEKMRMKIVDSFSLMKN